MALSARGSPREPTPPPVAKAPSGGTTALSASGGHPRQPPGSDPRQTSPRRAARTVIERPAPQSGQAAVPVSAPAQARHGAGAVGAAAAAPPKPARAWIAAVAGALASFVVVFLAVWALIPRPELKPVGPAAVPKTAPIVSDTPRPAADQPPPPPSGPETPAPPPAGAPT